MVYSYTFLQTTLISSSDASQPARPASWCQVMSLFNIYFTYLSLRVIFSIPVEYKWARYTDKPSKGVIWSPL